MDLLRRLQMSFIEEDQNDAIIDAVLSSDDEMFSSGQLGSRHGGSRVGRKRNVERGRALGAARIYSDYFSENPNYNDRLFRRRFRMRREVFLRVLNGVRDFDEYFEQKKDALLQSGLSTIQKVTAAIRQMAYGTGADACDEYIRIGESTAAVCLDRFAAAVVGRFAGEYLRAPTPEDLERIIRVNAGRGFPGLQGSLDCYNWKWDKCPKAKQGQFKGHKGTSISLEAVVDGELWFWHIHFGIPGALNDINVVQRSTLLHNLINGKSHPVTFSVNGNAYAMPYFLVDGIYPRWYVFMKSIPDPLGEAEALFTRMHEAIRKDVERGFGVIQARWAITKLPGRKWTVSRLSMIMHACIILHNMVIEDERSSHKLGQDLEFDGPVSARARTSNVMVLRCADDLVDGSFGATAARMMATRDFEAGAQLKQDLIAEMWKTHGN